MANKKTGGEAAYGRDELTSQARGLFQVRPEIVAGALHPTDKTHFTIDEAKRLVGQYLKRKVL